MELRIDNPCDRLRSVLGPQHHVVQHLRALPHGEVGSAIEAVRRSEAEPLIKLVFEFLVDLPPRAVPHPMLVPAPAHRPPNRVH